MSGVKIVAFDLDGTLFNSRSVSYDAIREGFEDFYADLRIKGPIPSWKEAKRLIGLPSHAFYPAILPEQFRPHWKILHRYVGRAEQRHLEKGHGHTFHGVHETLEELKERGYELRCLSNASKGYFDAVLDECNLRDFFTRFVHLGEDARRTKTDILKKWVKELEERGSIIYVGDRAEDIDAAHAAGIKVVGVTYGYGTRDELRDADMTIDRMPDLIRILCP